MQLFKEAADIKTADQLHLPTPTPIYHNVVAQPTEIQKGMVQELSERAAKVHAGIVDASTDNMLKITSDGRKLGLDQRVINPDLPDEAGSKVNMCVDNIYSVWKDGQADKLTQLVFCDLSTPKAAMPAFDHDGRISRDNKAWAQTVPVCTDADEWGHERSRYFLVSQVNPGLVNLLVSRVREELAKEKAAPAKRPSVLEKIQKNKTAIQTKTAEKKLPGQER
jgi:hypothetical protein